MKVFTNENNPQTLKIVVSANVSRHDVLCETVTTADARFQSPRKLPVLQLDCGSHLFSCNAASLYLFPPTAAAEKQVEQWLDWEAFKLQPLLVHVGSKTDPSSSILALFSELEKALENKNHLVQGELSVADVCISSSLYPLFVEDKLKSQYFANTPNLTRWLTSLFAQNEFKGAVEKLNLKKESLLPCLATSSWYPTPLGKQTAAPTASSTQDEGQEKRILTEEEIATAVLEWNKGVEHRLKLTSPQTPVLPRPGEDNILITSALPYVNNVPHLGNIIGCVLSADVFARYCRSRGWNTLYVGGTDEYGTATEMKALEEGLSPQQICDKYFTIHQEIYDWFSIGFDKFGRTSTPAQTEIVQDLFHQVHRNGYTFVEAVDQLLCEKCDRFLADRFVEGICPNCKYEDARGDQCDGCGHLINAIELIQPRCKQCQSTPVVRQSKQLFLDLPKIQAKVEDWASKTYDEWSNIAKVITKAWLKEGLKPRCITRDLKWGVPVPLEGFENKVFYVWFDAPIGYMSITKTYTDKWLEWWQPKSAKVTLYQFMAKDNVPFHSIIFPSTLHACDRGYTILKRLFATEYLNYENGKFSKSRGIGVFGNDAKETGIPSDIFRFYLLYLRPESQDSNFSWADLATKNNTELLNNLGNFILRSLSFTEKFFNSKIPPISLDAEEKELVALAAVELKSYILAMNKGRLREGVKYILNISRHGNGYMQSTQPWVLVKGTEEQKKKASSAIGLLCNLVALVASLLRPYMPQTVETIANQLNLDVNSLTIMETFHPYLKTGHQIGKPLPLFTKIEPAVVELLKQKYAGRQKSGSPEAAAPSGKLNLEGIDQLTALTALENAVTNQGELVRTMKAAGKSKDELKPHIATLLDLKKQLAEFQATNSIQHSTSSANGEPDRLKNLEAQIAAQGDKVRAMKAAGKSKDELKPHIATLLDLKKQLAQFQASNSVQDSTSSASGEPDRLKDLEAQIAAQGDKVREMKAAGKSKDELKPEIDKLLELKKKLPAQPEGNNATQKSESGSKNKKKNKKK